MQKWGIMVSDTESCNIVGLGWNSKFRVWNQVFVKYLKMRSSAHRKLKLFEMWIKTWNFRTTTYGVRSNAFLTSLSAHCAVCGGGLMITMLLTAFQLSVVQIKSTDSPRLTSWTSCKNDIIKSIVNHRYKHPMQPGVFTASYCYHWTNYNFNQ